jgi:hypothetical protein
MVARLRGTSWSVLVRSAVGQAYAAFAGRGLRPGVGEDCFEARAAAQFRGASDLRLLVRVDADTASDVAASFFWRARPAKRMKYRGNYVSVAEL